jgi:hypothetical protein
MKPRYVFIVGLPRTGSKLIKNVLENSQEGISYSYETFFMGRLIRPGVRHKIKKFGDMSNDANVYKFVEYMYSGKFAGLYWKKLRDGSLAVDKETLVQRLLGTDRSAKEIYKTILKVHAKEASNDTMFIDKAGPHLYHVPTLLKWFPDAKIIHAFRDPRAVLASEWRRRSKRRPKTILFKLISPLHTFWVVLHMTVAWFYAIKLHYKYEKRYPQNYYLLKFEDLINEPEKNIRLLCSFLDIEFQREMLYPEMTGSSYEPHEIVVGFDKKTLDRWKGHLKPWMNLWFSLLGKKFLKDFGYIR